MRKRLAAILSHVRGSVLADIGCDHGLIAVSALEQGLVERVIATDISASSLAKARALAAQRNAAAIEFRVGDGMRVLADGEADVVVIAGMGGKEIISIMSDRRTGVKRYILSPHRNAKELREFLVSHGFKIERDYIVKDGRHFYSVIVCSEGESAAPSPRQLHFGDNDYCDKTYAEYLNFERRKCLYVISQAGEGRAAEEQELLKLIDEEIALLC